MVGGSGWAAPINPNVALEAVILVWSCSGRPCTDQNSAAAGKWLAAGGNGGWLLAQLVALIQQFQRV